MKWDSERYLNRHGFIIERGRALLDLPAPKAGERILDLGGGEYYSPWFFPSPADCATRLEANGFSVRTAWHFDLPTQLHGDDGMRQWVLQFLPQQLEGLGPATHEAVLADMEADLRPALWRDGAWQADYRRLRVVAEAV
jgi:hypothetical protein